MNNLHTGIYPGTFDPFTNGHMDIVRRAMHIVDQLVIGVAVNTEKLPMFTFEERVKILKEEINDLKKSNGIDSKKTIEVKPFENVLVTFAKSIGASVIIRGIRAVSDFEFEFKMAGMNAKLDKNIETVFLMASDHHQFTSSKLVKEIAKLGGNISDFVSHRVEEKILEHIKREKK